MLKFMSNFDNFWYENSTLGKTLFWHKNYNPVLVNFSMNEY